MESTVSLHL